MTASQIEDAGPAPQPESVKALQAAIRSLRELLGMEIAWIAKFDGERNVLQVVDDVDSSFGFEAGDDIAADESYCRRLVLGRIDPIVPDTSVDDQLRGLDVTAEAGIASYIGVPIELDDGTVYGTLCCASHRPHHDLTERELALVASLSRRLASDLEGLELSAGPDS